MNNKSSIVTLIVILSIFVIGLTTGMILMMNKNFDFNFRFNFDDSNMTLVSSLEVNNETIDEIDIKVFSTDIEVKNSDNGIRLEYYSNTDNNTEIIRSNNSIILDENDGKNTCVGFCNINRKVIVYLPTDFSGYLSIETESGDIDSTNDMLDNLSIITTSGDVNLKGTADSHIVTTSGDININNVNKRLRVITTSGDVNVNKFNILENSTIESTSGDIDIINNNSNCYVETKTTSGDIKVNKSDRKSDLILNIKTTSGDINVD